MDIFTPQHISISEDVPKPVIWLRNKTKIYIPSRKPRTLKKNIFLYNYYSVTIYKVESCLQNISLGKI